MASERIYEFGNFRLDSERYLLSRDEQPVNLAPKAFDLLVFLVENRSRVVRKDELMKAVWPNSFVEESNLNQNIFVLRKALEEGRDGAQYIETVPRVGYRFAADVLPRMDGGSSTIAAPSGALAAAATPVDPTPTRHWRLAIIVAACLIGGAVTTLIVQRMIRISEPTPLLQRRNVASQARPVLRFSAAIDKSEGLDGNAFSQLAFSPDGTRVVYAAPILGSPQLFVRGIDSDQSQPIPAMGGSSPFFSPDGQWIVFSTRDSKMTKAPIHGGAPVVLADWAFPRGGSWGTNDEILFSGGPHSAVYQIPARGGTPLQIAAPDPKLHEDGYRWPQILPGNQFFLYTVVEENATLDQSKIEVQSFKTGVRRVLVDGGAQGRYVSEGFLVYSRDGALMAVPFDVSRMEVTGPPTTIVTGVFRKSNTSASQFGLSDNGSLVYYSGEFPASDSRELNLVDRHRKEERIPAPPKAYKWPRLSPDGSKLALTISESGKSDVWLYDLQHDNLRRLTFDESVQDMAVWTPDGKRVTYVVNKNGNAHVNWIKADGSSPSEELSTGSWRGLRVNGWSPDGETLPLTVFDSSTALGTLDIWMLRMHAEPRMQPFIATSAFEGGSAFSRDGRWLTYVSNESGRDQIYLRSFGGPPLRRQISLEGGREPVWAQNGRELFYRNNDMLVAVEISTQPVLTVSKTRELFPVSEYMFSGLYYANFDVGADGRFVMVKLPFHRLTEFHFLLNWFENANNSTKPS